MALLWMDSFDHYATADGSGKYNAFGGIITAAAGRRASGAVVITGNSPVSVTLNSANTTVTIGVAVKANSLTAQPRLIAIRSAATPQITVAFNGSGFLQAYRGDLGTLLGTAVTGALAVNVFAYVEVKVVIHPSAGSFIVRVNEAEVINLSGINTAQTGVAAWDNVAVNAASGISTTFDDLYICDGAGPAPLNGFLGDCRVDVRLPTAAGATTGWTPSAGANWAAVDDAAPNGDTDYVSAATSPLTDTYTIQDAPVPGAVLYGVQLCASLKKSDAGTCSVAPVVRHSGVDYPGTAVNPGTAYAFAVVPYGANPGTGAAWTEADFNAAEFGIKRTA